MFNLPTSSIKAERSTKKIKRVEAAQFEAALNAFKLEKQPEAVKSGRKLNLGDGLLAHVKKNNKVYFQLRYCLYGKNKTRQIGAYPEVTFESARTYADNYQAKFSATRKNNSEKAFTKRLQNLTQIVEIPCFTSMNKARAFITALITAIKVTEDTEKKELLLAIWLQLLIPDLGRRILKSHHHILYRDIETIMFSFNGFAPSYCILTPEIEEALNTLSNLRPEVKEGLFPSLYDQSDLEIKKRLQILINDFWSDLRINTDQFKAFFSYVGFQYGGFNTTFMKLTISGKDIKKGDYYNHQRKALRLWWCKQLSQMDLNGNSSAFLTQSEVIKKSINKFQASLKLNPPNHR